MQKCDAQQHQDAKRNQSRKKKETVVHKTVIRRLEMTPRRQSVEETSIWVPRGKRMASQDAVLEEEEKETP